MVSGYDIVAEASKWVGTPFRHQGRNEHGIDCVGLGAMIAGSLGLPVTDSTEYPQLCAGPELLPHLAAEFERVEGEPMPGDVVVFRLGEYTRHLAIFCGRDLMIHARQRKGGGGKVMQSRYSAWVPKLESVWRHREVV